MEKSFITSVTPNSLKSTMWNMEKSFRLRLWMLAAADMVHWQQVSWTSTPMYSVIITTTMGKVTLAGPTAAAITPVTEIGD